MIILINIGEIYETFTSLKVDKITGKPRSPVGELCTKSTRSGSGLTRIT